MRDLGYFGHFLHLHAGGRSGKQRMLERILREGGTISQRELQDTVPISSAAVSEVLAKLEFEGLITRTRSESDKRQLDVTLTENGQAEAKVCAEKHAKFEAEALSVLTEDEKGQLLGHARPPHGALAGYRGERQGGGKVSIRKKLKKH